MPSLPLTQFLGVNGDGILVPRVFDSAFFTLSATGKVSPIALAFALDSPSAVATLSATASTEIADGSSRRAIPAAAFLALVPACVQGKPARQHDADRAGGSATILNQPPQWEFRIMTIFTSTAPTAPVTVAQRRRDLGRYRGQGDHLGHADQHQPGDSHPADRHHQHPAERVGRSPGRQQPRTVPVINTDASDPVLVYPPSGAQFLALKANNPVQFQAGGLARFVQQSAKQFWLG